MATLNVIGAVVDVARVMKSLALLDRLNRGELRDGQVRRKNERIVHSVTLRYVDPRLELLYYDYKTQPGGAASRASTLQPWALTIL